MPTLIKVKNINWFGNISILYWTNNIQWISRELIKGGAIYVNGIL